MAEWWKQPATIKKKQPSPWLTASRTGTPPQQPITGDWWQPTKTATTFPAYGEMYKTEMPWGELETYPRYVKDVEEKPVEEEAPALEDLYGFGYRGIETPAGTYRVNPETGETEKLKGMKWVVVADVDQPDFPYAGSFEEWVYQKKQIPQELAKLEARRASIAESRAELRNEVSDLQSILGAYGGAADWVMTWLIQNDIDKLEHKRAILSAQADYLYAKEKAYGTEASTEGAIAKRKEELAQEASRYEAPTTLPIPSWMREYLEPSMTPTGEPMLTKMGEKLKGTKAPRAGETIPMGERGAFAMRPMGAQAELDVEQQQALAAYLGWGRAGAPLYFKDLEAGAMENLPAWWQQYTALSKSLFPQAGGRTGRRRVARQ